jgi:hypothetical protein
MLWRQNLFLRSLFAAHVPQLEPRLLLREFKRGALIRSDQADALNIFPVSAVFSAMIYPSFAPPTFFALLSPQNALFGREGDAPTEPPYDLRCLSDGYALIVPKAAFVEVVGRERWARVYAGAVSWWIASLMTISASCNASHGNALRVARFIAHAADAFGPDRPLTLSQADIAEFLDVRRETVSEVLDRAKTEGAITIDRARISVLDRGRLDAHVCPCYRSVAKVTQDLATDR